MRFIILFCILVLSNIFKPFSARSEEKIPEITDLNNTDNQTAGRYHI